MYILWIFTLLTTVYLALAVEDEQAETDEEETPLYCTNYLGEVVLGGEQFKSRQDPCERCVCEGGHAVRCMAVRCAPPECDLYEEEEGECCKFNCLTPADGPGDSSTNNSMLYPIDTIPVEEVDSANLGLRLVASTVSSFLILALFLFIVHRLRQRRILIMMRRMNEEHGHDDAVAYMSQFDHIDMGIEFPPYEDPPPPYTPPKPPTIPMGDAPPPYEVSQGMGNNNEGENNGGSDNGPLLRMEGRPVQGAAPLHPERARCEMQTQSQDLRRSVILTNASLISGFLDSHTNESDEAMFVDIMDNGRQHGDATVNSVGTSTGVECASFPPTENYGLSVAVASVASDLSPNSPSHVIVRLHNNSPQTQVRCTSSESPHSVSTTISDGAALSRKPIPHAQFIKRSDSMEIKHANSNPRNSYSKDNLDRSAPGDLGESENSSEDETQPDNTAYSNPAFDASTWNQTMKHCRKSENANLMSPSSQHNAEVGYQKGLSPERSVEGKVQRPPGLDLDLDRAAGASHSAAYSLGPSQSATGAVHSDNHPSQPQSHWQPAVSGVPDGATGNTTPSTGTSSPMSPMSPVASLMGRSGSITSQFSVCSETGERKRPLQAVPVALRNDAPYPLSPLSLKYVVPPLPSVAGSHNSSSASVTPSNSSSQLPVATSEPVASPKAQSNSGQPSTSLVPQYESHPPRISYVDQNFNDVNETLPKTATEPEEPESDKKRSLRIKRSDSGNSRSGCREIASDENPPRNTVRKIKQKKRRSRASVQSPQDGGMVNRDASHSPERYKNSAKVRDSPGMTFKQYGFIDNPEVLASKDVVPDSPTIDRPPDRTKERRRNSSKEKRRNSSKEKKRDGSSERRDRSNERKKDCAQDRSKSRDSSGERLRRDGSRDHKRERSNSRDRNKRSNSLDKNTRDNIRGKVSTQDGYMGDVSEDSVRYNDSGWRRKKSTPDQDNTEENILSGTDVVFTKESRPLERDIVQGSASLERKRKRRSNGERYVPEAGHIMAAILGNGHIDQFDNVNHVNSLRNNKMAHPGVKSSKSYSAKNKDNRNGIPVIVHKQALPDR